MTTNYELEKRYGIREVRNLTSAFRIFSRACILVHLFCVIGLGCAAANEVLNRPVRTWATMPTTLEIVIGLGTFTCLFMNRPAMYLALRILMQVEAAISVSRTRQSRGWQGFFVDMFSMSLLIPPGDLLAIVLLLMLIRNNTDHFDERLTTIFQRSELGLGIGAALQYAGIFLLFAWVYLARTADATSLIILAILAHLTLLAGVVSVEWSLSAMQRELSEVVRLRHTITDTAESFLAELSIAPVEE